MACFRCHDTPAILGALGLELADLYPERIKDPSPEARRAAREAFKRSAWATAVRVLDREATVVGIACTDMLAGKALPPADVARLDVALDRIHHVREVLA
ncbi:MAG: hypothetical protein EPN40_12875 [Rhodanobacteraceae bacterium]|nr:MAG: hypothetical protein EPN40_12875 [Rhodanobacteraceae bacterium]